MQGGGRAKNLLLKLINAIYTKCGKNQGSLVFGIRSLHWNVIRFCSEP